MNFPFVQYYMTKKCDSGCKHCFLSAVSVKKNSEFNELSIDGVKQAFFDLKKRGYDLVVLGGAEPTQHKDFNEIVKCLYNMGFKIKLHTNGMSIDMDRARLLSECNLFEVRVSLDGSTQLVNDQIRGVGSYEKILTGIRNMIMYNIPVTIAITLNKNNLCDIGNIIDLAYKKGIKCVHSYLLIDKGRGQNLKDLLLDSDDIRRAHDIFKNKRAEYSTSTKISLNEKMACVSGIPFLSIREDGEIKLYENSRISYGKGIHSKGHIFNKNFVDIVYDEEIFKCMPNCKECKYYASLNCLELDNYCFDDIYF